MAIRRATAQIMTMNDSLMIDRMPDELLWQTVLTRQAGNFLYAVTTMGVYCRPGCPSPPPLRKNVRYFRSPEQAEAIQQLNSWIHELPVTLLPFYATLEDPAGPGRMKAEWTNADGNHPSVEGYRRLGELAFQLP